MLLVDILCVQATSSPSIKNTHSMHMLPPTSDVTDAQSDNGTAADSQPRRGTPSNAASAVRACTHALAVLPSPVLLCFVRDNDEILFLFCFACG